MADLKRRVKEEDDTDAKPDGSDVAQGPSTDRTSSRKDGAPVRPSSDGQEKPTSGGRPSPSPAGALVNGPASGPASDEPAALNEGGVRPGEAPRAESAGELSSPLVLDLPGELRSDGGENAEGPGPEAASGPDDANGGSPEALSTTSPSGKTGKEAATGRVGAGDGTGDGETWGFETESSESSSDDYDLGWRPRKYLWNDPRKEVEEEEEGCGRKAEIPSVGQRQWKRKVDTAEMRALSPAPESSPSNDVSERHGPLTGNKAHSFREKPGRQSPVDSSENAPTETRFNGDGDVKADSLSTSGGTFKHSEAESSMGSGSEREPLFFSPCTKCDVNFNEKRHLHRHVMYRWDGRDQAGRASAPRPFICRECGRAFRDRGSLLKHAVVHRERREKLMDEIKGLGELRDEGPAAGGRRGPWRVTGCPQTFVRHSTERDGRLRYACEDCGHVAAAERELEARLCSARRLACAPRYATVMKSHRLQELGTFAPEKDELLAPASFSCETCPFGARDESALGKRVELACRRPPRPNGFESPSCDEADGRATPAFQPRFPTRPQRRPRPQTEFCVQRQAFGRRAQLPFWSDLFAKSKSTQKARKGCSSSLSGWSVGDSTNKLSPFSGRSETPGKLSLQRAEKIDVTTGLPCDGERKNGRAFGSVFSGDAMMPKSILSCYEPLVPKMESSSAYCVGYDFDNGGGGDGEPDGSRLAALPVTKKPHSKRKMSTPYHNTTDKATHVILSKHEHAAKRHLSEDGYEDAYDFSDYTSEATANFLDCSENERNPYARSYFIRRQRGPLKTSRAPSAGDFQRNGAEEKACYEIRRCMVKEECVEVSLGPPASDEGPRIDSPGLDASYFGAERRSCPYCPAVFESGVGLSNHVRGHLHRVGLSYDARHVVTAEQVASRDRRLRVRRKVPPASRRVKKVEKQESPTEHTCPLCGGWFDTKTGLSNHVRGHLKRIGKTISGASKSPVCILNEMMKDKEEHRNILQVLDRKRFLSRPFVSQKFASSEGLFLTPTGIPVKIQRAGQNGEPWGPSAPPQGTGGPEKDRAETERGAQGPPSSSLIELLKKRKLNEELELKNGSQSARKHFATSLPNESGAGTRLFSWVQEKSEAAKKVCLHCNATFPSAVSLSNHLRAYARRKRAALLEGTSYDCKQKKARSRPGPKKKIFALPHATDEIYRLTCRFCDLVFQGPLSVQEDWIKHLQRHIMHTSVPCTGAGMVEVTSLPSEPPSVPVEPTPPLLSRAAS